MSDIDNTFLSHPTVATAANAFVTTVRSRTLYNSHADMNASTAAGNNSTPFNRFKPGHTLEYDPKRQIYFRRPVLQPGFHRLHRSHSVIDHDNPAFHGSSTTNIDFDHLSSSLSPSSNTISPLSSTTTAIHTETISSWFVHCFSSWLPQEHHYISLINAIDPSTPAIIEEDAETDDEVEEDNPENETAVYLASPPRVNRRSYMNPVRSSVTLTSSRTSGSTDQSPLLLVTTRYCLHPLRRCMAGCLRSTMYVFRFFWKHVMFETIWLFLFLLGICSALLAWVVDELVEILWQLKVFLAQSGEDYHPLAAFIIWTSFTVLFAVLSLVVTQSVSPVAAGSGIPEMRSVLSGFQIQGYLSLRTLVAKCLGLIFAMGSGLVIGKEGPFVHISCIICYELLQFELFRTIQQSPALTRQVLQAACAVGVSSTFGAPIGGVLFSIEVTSSLYQTEHYWKGFFCAVCGAFAFKELSYFGNSRDKLISLFTTNFAPLPYSLVEIPFFIVLSLGCGALGGFFVLSGSRLRQFLKQHKNESIFIRNSTLNVVLLAIFTAAIQYPLGEFMRLGLQRAIDDLFLENDLVSGTNSTHYNDWDTPTLYVNLPLFASIKFILANLALTLALPSGVFTPVFAIGAAWGRLYGELMHLLGGPQVTAGGYALVGAAAFTSGVTGTVSTAVIVFELTSQLSYMLPVLLSVLIGKVVYSYL